MRYALNVIDGTSCWDLCAETGELGVYSLYRERYRDDYYRDSSGHLVIFKVHPLLTPGAYGYGEAYDKETGTFIMDGEPLSVVLDGDRLSIGGSVIKSLDNYNASVVDIICTGYSAEEHVWQMVCLLDNMKGYLLFFDDNGICVGVYSDISELDFTCSKGEGYLAEISLLQGIRFRGVVYG